MTCPQVELKNFSREAKKKEKKLERGTQRTLYQQGEARDFEKV